MADFPSQPSPASRDSSGNQALRRMFVRDAVAAVLAQCRGVWLLEGTLMRQVNLTLQPNAGPSEISEALHQLNAKGKCDWRVDEDDHQLKSWRLTSLPSPPSRDS